MDEDSARLIAELLAKELSEAENASRAWQVALSDLLHLDTAAVQDALEDDYAIALRYSLDETNAELSERAAHDYESKDARAAADSSTAKRIALAFEASTVKEQLDHEMAVALQETDDAGEYDIDQVLAHNSLEDIVGRDKVERMSVLPLAASQLAEQPKQDKGKGKRKAEGPPSDSPLKFHFGPDIDLDLDHDHDPFGAELKWQHLLRFLQARRRPLHGRPERDLVESDKVRHVHRPCLAGAHVLQRMLDRIRRPQNRRPQLAQGVPDHVSPMPVRDRPRHGRQVHRAARNGAVGPCCLSLSSACATFA